MYISAIAILLAAILAILMVNANRDPAVNAVNKAYAEAASFVAYRNAVVEYAQTHTTYNGNVATNQLAFPKGYTSAYTWSNHLNNGLVLVWGTLPAGGVAAASQYSQYSITVGTTVMQGSNEVIISPEPNAIPVSIPSGIVPVGVTASAVQVN